MALYRVGAHMTDRDLSFRRDQQWKRLVTALWTAGRFVCLNEVQK